MTSDVIIVYRDSDTPEAEQKAIREHFRASVSFTDVRCGDVVIARYCAEPFYADRYTSMRDVDARIVNTPSEHEYASNLRLWYEDLRGLTPETWFSPDAVPHGEVGPFVLKGETYSQRFQWDTHMFAADRAAIRAVYERLREDPLVSQRPIFVRRFVRFASYGTARAGHPIAKEFRFFVLDGQVLSGGFYWSGYVDTIGHVPDATEVPPEFLTRVTAQIGLRVRFYHLDVALDEAGRPWVVEIGDAQHAGLSCNDPETLYRRLHQAFDPYAKR